MLMLQPQIKRYQLHVITNKKIQRFAFILMLSPQQELQNIFTGTNWYFALRELQELIQEHKDNLLPECIAWISELIEKQKAFYEVSNKFKERVIQLWNQNPAVEENQVLQQRIKDAANYFSGEIVKWKEKFRYHALSTDTKKIARKIDASLNEIHNALHEILHKINHCKNGFMLDEYLKKGKKAIELNENIQSSYAQNQVGNISSKESVHEELYERIAEMRKRIGREINFPEPLLSSYFRMISRVKGENSTLVLGIE